MRKFLSNYTLSILISLLVAAPFAGAASADNLYPPIKVSSAKEFDRLRMKLNSTSGVGKIWLRWDLARWAIVYNRTTWAEKNLKILLNSKQTEVSKDGIHLHLARLYYQKGALKRALNHYNKIPMSSDYWLEAKEEMAWARLRQKNYDGALSSLETLLSTFFDRQVGPEPYYLASLTRLKICDYPGVFKITKQFKKRYEKRIVKLEELAETGGSVEANAVFNDFLKKPMSYQTVGSRLHALPYLFYRDLFFSKYIYQYRYWIQEGDNIEKAMNVQTKAFKRLQQLAKRDLKEASRMIKLLQVVEAEAIQRLYGAKKPNAKLAIRDKAKARQLVFPRDSKEVWLDELDNYQVWAKDCPGKKASSL